MLKKVGYSKGFFARMLFISIIVLIMLVYLLLIFNNVFSRISNFGYWILYIILVLLLAGLVSLLRPFGGDIKRWYKNKMSSMSEKRLKRALERKRRKTERLKLREERKRKKLLEKQRKKAESLRIREEQKKSRLLKKGKKEKLRGRGKERKVEERKIVYTKAKTERKSIVTFLLALFLLSVIVFLIAYYYRSMVIMISSVVLIFVSLLVHRLLGVKKGKRAEKKEEKAKKEEKVQAVKELPRITKIGLGRYETDFDALYKIVEQKERVKLSALAGYFGVDKKKVEEWATILEKHNLVVLHYPAVGEAEVRKIGSSPTEKKAES